MGGSATRPLMTPVELITQARIAIAPSGVDNDLARNLSVTRQTISEWRVGRRPIPDTAIVALAELASVDPGYALATMHAHYASGRVRDYWLKVARRVEIWNANPSWSGWRIEDDELRGPHGEQFTVEDLEHAYTLGIGGGRTSMGGLAAAGSYRTLALMRSLAERDLQREREYRREVLEREHLSRVTVHAVKILAGISVEPVGLAGGRRTH